MIERYYHCDLCRKQFDPHQEDVAFGLIWKGNDVEITKQLLNIEHHICIDCYQAIRRKND